MKLTKSFMLIAFSLFIGLAGFGASAAPHFCAAHCANHSDPDAKMCMTHCTTGVAEGHDCAAHCKNLPSDDQDKVCATHCAAK